MCMRIEESFHNYQYDFYITTLFNHHIFLNTFDMSFTFTNMKIICPCIKTILLSPFWWTTKNIVNAATGSAIDFNGLSFHLPAIIQPPNLMSQNIFDILTINTRLGGGGVHDTLLLQTWEKNSRTLRESAQRARLACTRSSTQLSNETSHSSHWVGATVHALFENKTEKKLSILEKFNQAIMYSSFQSIISRMPFFLKLYVARRSLFSTSVSLLVFRHAFSEYSPCTV